MTQYFAASGLPFTDSDAAEFKAERMSRESGSCFEVVPVTGGFAIENRLADVDEHNNPSAVAVDPPPQVSHVSKNTAAADQAFVVSLRPAWRAQLVGFLLILLGAVLVVAPTWPIALFSVGAVYTVNDRFPGLWDDITLFGFAIILVGLISILWQRYYQHSTITNVGVMQSVGILFNRHVSEIKMTNIHVVDVKQPNLLHMILNFGTVELSTPGSGGADVAIVDVVSPRRVAAFVREQVDRARTHQHDHSLSFRSSK